MRLLNDEAPRRALVGLDQGALAPEGNDGATCALVPPKLGEAHHPDALPRRADDHVAVVEAAKDFDRAVCGHGSSIGAKPGFCITLKGDSAHEHR
jgi:hypothetical protein